METVLDKEMDSYLKQLNEAEKKIRVIDVENISAGS